MAIQHPPAELRAQPEEGVGEQADPAAERRHDAASSQLTAGHEASAPLDAAQLPPEGQRGVGAQGEPVEAGGGQRHVDPLAGLQARIDVLVVADQGDPALSLRVGPVAVREGRRLQAEQRGQPARAMGAQREAAPQAGERTQLVEASKFHGGVLARAVPGLEALVAAAVDDS